MSNTMDNETKSNLEKAIATQILDPIQRKYNDLKKQKEKDIKDTEKKVTPKTSFLDRLDEASKEESEKDYTDISRKPIVEKEQLPLPPPPAVVVSQELVMSPPNEEFKSYLIGLKDSITDKDNGDDYEIDSNNQKELVQLIDDKLTWLDSNLNASDKDIEKQQEELRKTIEDKASSISETWRDTPAPPAPPSDTKGKCFAETYEIDPAKQCDPDTKEPLKQAKFRLHPDKNPGCTEEATRKFQALTNACEKYIPSKETESKEAAPEAAPEAASEAASEAAPEAASEAAEAPAEAPAEAEAEEAESPAEAPDSQIDTYTNVQKLLPILRLLAEKRQLEKDMATEEKTIQDLQKQAKIDQDKQNKEIKETDSQIDTYANVQKLLPILKLLAQKLQLEKEIRDETKAQADRNSQLEKDLLQLEKETEQYDMMKKLLPLLPLLVKKEQLYDELHPKKDLKAIGKDLQQMFSNARGMLPSMPSMPSMCNADISGSAKQALSGLSTYLSTLYQDWFEPYNEELIEHRPPEQLDSSQIDDFKYLGRFSMDMEIGEQPFKQVTHLYFNFKENMFHTEIEMDDILAVDKEVENKLGIDPSKYPYGAVAVLGKNPEILGRAISKDDPSYQQKLDLIKQALTEGIGQQTYRR